jgi:hypothetical protein
MFQLQSMDNITYHYCNGQTRLEVKGLTYSGPSGYDRLDIRTTLVKTKILVLTYDQSLELRPACRSRPLELRPTWRSYTSIRVFVDVILVSALLYIINFAN